MVGIFCNLCYCYKHSKIILQNGIAISFDTQGNSVLHSLMEAHLNMLHMFSVFQLRGMFKLTSFMSFSTLLRGTVIFHFKVEDTSYYTTLPIWLPVGPLGAQVSGFDLRNVFWQGPLDLLGALAGKSASRARSSLGTTTRR